jgi:predicted ABC-type ATPase
MPLNEYSHGLSQDPNTEGEAVIRRRYHAGLKNFFQLYRPIADAWRFYDNTSARPRLVAKGTGETELVFNAELWETVPR